LLREQHGLDIAARPLPQVDTVEKFQSSVRSSVRLGRFFAPQVDTVEKFQSRERQIIFISYDVAYEAYSLSEAEFLLSRNRFNVAAAPSANLSSSAATRSSKQV
jgi:hypothetical protein